MMIEHFLPERKEKIDAGQDHFSPAMIVHNMLFFALYSVFSYSHTTSNDVVLTISSNGTDSAGCGTSEDHGCATISYALSAHTDVTAVTFPRDSISDTYIPVSCLQLLLHVFTFLSTSFHLWLILL